MERKVIEANEGILDVALRVAGRGPLKSGKMNRARLASDMQYYIRQLYRLVRQAQQAGIIESVENENIVKELQILESLKGAEEIEEASSSKVKKQHDRLEYLKANFSDVSDDEIDRGIQGTWTLNKSLVVFGYDTKDEITISKGTEVEILGYYDGAVELLYDTEESEDTNFVYPAYTDKALKKFLDFLK